MNPQNIRFTQRTCTNQGNGYTVEGNIEALQNGSLSPDDLEPIRVFQKKPEMDAWGSKAGYGYAGDLANLENGQWYTLDNRRLLAYQAAEITDIPVLDVSDQSKLIQSQI